MKTITSILLILILSINFQLNAQELKSYENKDVIVKYPSNWEIVDVDKKKKENPDNPMMKSTVLEIRADKDDESSKSVKAMKMDTQGRNPSLADIESFFENMYNSSEKVVVLKKSKGQINGYDYRSMTVKSNVEDVDKIGVQRYFIYNKYIYVVSVSSKFKEFPKFKPTADKLLDSFKTN